MRIQGDDLAAVRVLEDLGLVFVASIRMRTGFSVAFRT
jgi:hypothetical protein